jgi:hypothetical protein
VVPGVEERDGVDLPEALDPVEEFGAVCGEGVRVTLEAGLGDEGQGCGQGPVDEGPV